ncbi:IS21 family transposase [Vibrio aestuarianus]|uniref:IS21 family transposase n=1 Tax=Vibrio TaxID=662 RepID=UPI001CDBDFF0|nr:MULTISPECIES: IS21 family transposase [Vibrio]MDE1226137.1 IS21 family transposase [Vibrio aestuarianus]MDE1312828.1 IS21 family transposase [Vibrio aestuarianus]MDF9401365.1 IS21 family transposase [Vibrio sp. 1180_3]
MIDVSLLSVIRRWHFREGMSQREIARRTGLSRNTVKRYLKDQTIEPVYPKRHSLSKLDEFEELLTSWLKREMKRPRKQRKTVKNLFQDLVPLGYSGSYDRVASFARKWREEQKLDASKRTYMPLEFAPGEAFQFDWGENWAYINGHKTKLQVAHFKLSHSRAFLLRAYYSQSHEMLFDAHNHAFRVFQGVPERGIYDNMKTAVDAVRKGKERVVNRRFLTMVSHYLFEADFCNPAAGWEKGQIEKNVRDARSIIWQRAPRVKTLDELNEWLEVQCLLDWQSRKHPQYRDMSIEQVWLNERSHLMKVTAPFDGFTEQSKRVSSTCLVNFDRNKYSVPASYANRRVSLHAYPDSIVLVAEGQPIAEHQRVFNPKHEPPHIVYNWRHYLLVAQRKPGSLRNGAPFYLLPESFKHLQSILLQRLGGDKEMVEVLSLVLHHDEKLVEQAINMALKAGTPSKQHVINCLSRLLNPTPAVSVPVSQGLRLVTEPTSDTSRYDELRGKRHAQ